MKKKGQIYIGTSGWHYKHWIGTFYPIDTAEADQLAVYQSSFSTVELNNSFYRLPTAKAFRDWKAQTPDGFTFAVKASRFITHMKKLNVGKADIDKFLHRAGHLENKLGPILFQLPPNWNINTERLSRFLSLLPHGHRYVFEFRNASWESDGVYQLLEEYGCAYCIYELGGYMSPEKVTGDSLTCACTGRGQNTREAILRQTSGNGLQDVGNGWRGERTCTFILITTRTDMQPGTHVR